MPATSYFIQKGTNPWEKAFSREGKCVGGALLSAPCGQRLPPTPEPGSQPAVCTPPWAGSPLTARVRFPRAGSTLSPCLPGSLLCML